MVTDRAVFVRRRWPRVREAGAALSRGTARPDGAGDGSAFWVNARWPSCPRTECRGCYTGNFPRAGGVLLKFRLESNLRSLSENGSKNHDRCRPGVVRTVKILPGSLAWNYHVI